MLESAMQWLGFGLCHQLPDRSFVAGGLQLPVCARDTGLYIGFVVSLAIIALFDRGEHRSETPPAWLLGIGAAAVALMLWDGLTSYFGMRETTNLLRLASGLGTGFALPLVLAPAINSTLWTRTGQGRVLGEAWQAVAWLASIPLTMAALWWGAPWLGAGYAVLTAVCILVTLTAVNVVIVALIPRFAGSAPRLRDAWPAVAAAMLVTFVELALADLLRLALLTVGPHG